MATFMAQAKKVGGSLMVRIPAEVAAQEGIKEGDNVDLVFHKARKSWFGAFPKVGPFTKEDRLRSKHE